MEAGGLDVGTGCKGDELELADVVVADGTYEGRHGAASVRVTFSDFLTSSLVEETGEDAYEVAPQASDSSPADNK